MWEVATGACLQTLEAHSKWVNSAQFSPDGLRVVTGSGDHTARVWEVATGACLQSLAGHTNDVLSAQFSPCLLYTSPSPRDGLLSRMPSSA